MMGTRCRCGEVAVAILVYRWANGTEASRTRPVCAAHYQKALNLWERVCPPDLSVLVVSP